MKPPELTSALFLTLPMISLLALAGCAKNQSDETENPDAAADGESTADGADGAATQSRARGSTVTRSAGRLTKARLVTSKKPPRAVVDIPEGEEESGPNGLFAEAYSLTAVDALPDFTSLDAPVESFEVANLDIDEDDVSNGFPGATDLSENYALRFSGSLNILEEAEYELCLHSDDGSQLLLEDTLVVDNDGVHDSPVEACELVYLAPGEYALEVRYFQATGPLLAMHFAWAINGGEKVIVPSEVLFKPDSAGV
ncbi:PA14 domain protein [Enhygromyxa salina]|uniref:PA14 domain protein n=1 Tax=Enhygromyxa salina TaxID=215803 RepID=A0A2S9YFB9_9BACT|nr:PA14 domain-containing protein [Enhygromyxa salina]PRQ03716.1 PA14 domain protein [Enhygromyxa salina]